MRTLEATTEIDATPHEVWAVLTDFARHPDWNPFIRAIVGECAVGARLRTTIAPPGGRAVTLRPVVLAADPVHELRWLGRLFVPRVFDGEHSFRIEALGAGRTRFTQSETFRGLLVPFTSGVLAKTGVGFEAMNRALAQEVQRRRDDQAGGTQPASWMSSAATGSTSSSTCRNSNPASSA
jgi:hypothetical protein